MEIQLSSGQGPAECELTVGKLSEALQKEFPGISIKSAVYGVKKNCYKSMILESKQDLSFLEGSVQWICWSPFRKNHKRKNWYVDISIAHKAQTHDYDDSLVRFETFRCSGSGGQHVNKVETGVRAIYLPLMLSVEATEARSQHQNKKLALDRLCKLVDNINSDQQAESQRRNWLEHMRLERGNPVRVYEGSEFKRIK